MPIVYRSRRFFYFPTIVEGAWRMSCTVCTQSGVIEDLVRAEGQRGRELDEKSLNLVNQLLRRRASTPLAHRCTIFLCHLGCEI